MDFPLGVSGARPGNKSMGFPRIIWSCLPCCGEWGQTGWIGFQDGDVLHCECTYSSGNKVSSEPRLKG